MLEDEIIAEKDGELQFIKPYILYSKYSNSTALSQAASLIMYSNRSGWKTWTDKTGKPLAENDELRNLFSYMNGADDELDGNNTLESLFPNGSEARKLYNTLKEMLLSLDSTLIESPTNCYITFKKGKGNTVSFWPKNNWVEVVFNAKLGQLSDPNGLLIDITNRKWSAAQYALKYYADTDTQTVKDLMKQTLDLKH